MTLSEIKENPRNPRTISKEKFEKLKQSIQEFPEMLELRPLVVDDEGVVLGGNMRLKAMIALGMDDVPDSWIRKASELTQEQKERFIIADNLPFGEWDWDILANEWNAELLTDWGMEVNGMDPEELYTKKIQAPTYEPSDEKPLVEDLYDMTKTRELIDEIDKVANKHKLPQDLWDFLRYAAMRHTVFRYDWIADYYAHAPKEVQDLMEKSALVVIDFEKAISQGFVELSKYLLEIRENGE